MQSKNKKETGSDIKKRVRKGEKIDNIFSIMTSERKKERKTKENKKV